MECKKTDEPRLGCFLLRRIEETRERNRWDPSPWYAAYLIGFSELNLWIFKKIVDSLYGMFNPWNAHRERNEDWSKTVCFYQSVFFSLDCLFRKMYFPPSSRRCGIAKLSTARLHLKNLSRNNTLVLISYKATDTEMSSSTRMITDFSRDERRFYHSFVAERMFQRRLRKKKHLYWNFMPASFLFPTFLVDSELSVSPDWRKVSFITDWKQIDV